MSIRELMVRVEVLEDKAIIVGNFERGDSSMGSVVQMEERIEGLKNAQQPIVQMVSEMSVNLRAAFRLVWVDVANLSARLTSPCERWETKPQLGVYSNSTR